MGTLRSPLIHCVTVGGFTPTMDATAQVPPIRSLAFMMALVFMGQIVRHSLTYVNRNCLTLIGEVTLGDA